MVLVLGITRRIRYTSKWTTISELGSAGEFDGNVVVVSIYVNDNNTKWTEEDLGLISKSFDYVETACQWLECAAEKYSKEVHFIYDWKKNSDLFYEANLNINLTEVSNDNLNVINDYIENNIDSDKLRQQYKSNNVIYTMYVNTPLDNNITSNTYCYYEGNGIINEVCIIMMKADNEIECPASIAHEILHAFGAPDLYLPDINNDNYGITKEYVEELENNNSNDIMFTTFDAITEETYYDRITNELSDVDAYYIGLLDQCPEVEKRGFLPSQHIR